MVRILVSFDAGQNLRHHDRFASPCESIPRPNCSIREAARYRQYRTDLLLTSLFVVERTGFATSNISVAPQRA
jgi:hypothetical protein